jgi:hypothetical protein
LKRKKMTENCKWSILSELTKGSGWVWVWGALLSKKNICPVQQEATDGRRSVVSYGLSMALLKLVIYHPHGDVV